MILIKALFLDEVNQCHSDVLSVLAHRLHELHDAENLHREAAEKGTDAIREWIGQIIMIISRL